jgi:hypothetical protein
MASVSTISSAGTLQGATDGKPSVALLDKLARCIQQLGDWQPCPSSKTPEGKQMIQNLQTQIRSIDSRIASADKGTALQSSVASSSQGSAQVVNISRATGLGLIGRLVDAFA